MKKYIISGFGTAIAALFMIFSVGHADIVGSIKGIAGGIASKTQESVRDSGKKIMKETTKNLQQDLKQTGQSITQDAYSIVSRPLKQMEKSDFLNYLLEQMKLGDKKETCQQGGACRALEALGCRTSKNFVSICSLICHDYPGFQSSTCIKNAQTRFGFTPSTQGYTTDDGKTESNKDHIIRQIKLPQDKKTTHDFKFWNDFCHTNNALIPVEHQEDIANACRVTYGQYSSEESSSHDISTDETAPSISQPSDLVIQAPQEPTLSRPQRPQRPTRSIRPVRPAPNPEVVMDRMMLDIQAQNAADFCQKCHDRNVCSSKLVYSLCAASCDGNLPTCTSAQEDTLGFTKANPDLLLNQVNTYLADKIYDDNPQSNEAPLNHKEEKLLNNYCISSNSFMKNHDNLNDAKIACQQWAELAS